MQINLFIPLTFFLFPPMLKHKKFLFFSGSKNLGKKIDLDHRPFTFWRPLNNRKVFWHFAFDLMNFSPLGKMLTLKGFKNLA